MKRALITLCLLFTFGISVAQESTKPLMIAHRGGWTERNITNEDGSTSKVFVVPENSIARVAMAKRFGYDGIECDVKYTVDSVLVLMHDSSLNRTARHSSDYSPLTKKTRVREITFEQLRRDYVLASDDPSLRTQVPTLEEMLLECKKHGMLAVLHSKIPESYAVAQKILGDDGWVAFNSNDNALMEARKVSNCLILLDPGKHEDRSIGNTIRRLEALGGRCGVSSMKRDLLTAEFCQAMLDKGYHIQSSIFKTPHEVQALRNGVTILLTDFAKQPESDREPVMQLSKSNYQKSRPIRKVWNRELECGALTVEIDFVGTATIVLNGKRQYTLTRDKRGIDRFGTRFTEGNPSLLVKIANGGVINSLQANVYEY